MGVFDFAGLVCSLATTELPGWRVNGFADANLILIDDGWQVGYHGPWDSGIGLALAHWHCQIGIGIGIRILTRRDWFLHLTVALVLGLAWTFHQSLVGVRQLFGAEWQWHSCTIHACAWVCLPSCLINGGPTKGLVSCLDWETGHCNAAVGTVQKPRTRDSRTKCMNIEEKNCVFEVLFYFLVLLVAEISSRYLPNLACPGKRSRNS